MKLKDLKVGDIYKCKLTGRKVLVIEQDKMVEKKEKEEVVMESVKVIIGKWANSTDDGTLTYYYQELFDGQLEKQ